MASRSFCHVADAERRRKRSCVANSHRELWRGTREVIAELRIQSTGGAARRPAALGDGTPQRVQPPRTVRRISSPACAADFLLTAWSGYPRPAGAIARHAPLTWHV
jgi:hypothetical protein